MLQQAFAAGDRARLSAARVMVDGGPTALLKPAEVTPLVRRKTL